MVEQPARRRDEHVDAGCGTRAPAVPLPTPPNTAAPLTGVCTAQVVQVFEDLRRKLTSRVITRARVAPRGVRSDWCRIGSRNAAVFPLPVLAQASTSRPARAGGMASVWIGVGRMNPSSLMPFRRLGWSLSGVNGKRQSF